VVSGYAFEIDSNPGVLYPIDISASEFVIEELNNGTRYGIRMITYSDIGDSDFSDTVYETPYTVPSAPIITSIVAVNWTAEIEFEIPDNGGSPITDIRYILSNNPTEEVSIGPYARNIKITQLLNKNTYEIRIIAFNKAGLSPPPAELQTFVPTYSATKLPLIKQRSPINDSLTKYEQYALTVRISKGKAKVNKNY